MERVGRPTVGRRCAPLSESSTQHTIVEPNDTRIPPLRKLTGERSTRTVPRGNLASRVRVPVNLSNIGLLNRTFVTCPRAFQAPLLEQPHTPGRREEPNPVHQSLARDVSVDATPPPQRSRRPLPDSDILSVFNFAAETSIASIATGPFDSGGRPHYVGGTAASQPGRRTTRRNRVPGGQSRRWCFRRRHEARRRRPARGTGRAACVLPSLFRDKLA